MALDGGDAWAGWAGKVPQIADSAPAEASKPQIADVVSGAAKRTAP